MSISKINKMWCIHTIKEVLIHATEWISLEDIMFGERSW